MKKKLLSLLLVLTMVFSMSACGTKDKAKDSGSKATKAPASTADSKGEDSSLKYIQDRGKLILGLDDSFPPMGFRDDANKIVGFDIDLAGAVCKKLGIKLVCQPISWDAKEQELSTKNIDCIWNGFSVTPERQKSLTMSIPYMENKIALVVNKDSKIKGMADMKGKSLAVQSGSSAEEALNSSDNKAFKDSLGTVNNGFKDYVTALMDLETGNSDAVLMDSVVANYMITKGKKNFTVLSDNLVAEEYAVGFRKGDEALCGAVNKALQDLKADGTVATISTKWFGSDITTIK